MRVWETDRLYMRRSKTSDPFKWYPCDRIKDRDGVNVCCIWSELQVDEARPPEGSVRCGRHFELIGVGLGVKARDSEHAREILRSR